MTAGIKQRSGATNSSLPHPEIGRFLAESRGVIIQSTIRLRKAEQALKQADQDNRRTRACLSECWRLLGLGDK